MSKSMFSAIMMALLVFGTLTLFFNIKPVWASGTITINADGSITPATAPIYSADNITYTITGNITSDADGIVVKRDNIVVDGAGYTVKGVSGNGITLGSRNNVTIKNTTIELFDYGILLESASNHNSVSGNNITTNNGYGVWLESSSNYNSISENNITNNGIGIYLYSTSGNRISGNNITTNHAREGIWLDSSSNTTISGNNITANDGAGINLANANDNTVSRNVITNNGLGINLPYSSNNNISGNIVTNSYRGIDMGSSNNSISGNNIANNIYEGIYLEYSSSGNIISRNNITNNGYGVHSDSSSNNVIYHNNFVDNTQQVYSDYLTNIWDDGYPSGGNYWTDYNGTDLFKGPYQNVSGSDGIGDTQYVINQQNLDHYPLMNESPPQDQSVMPIANFTYSPNTPLANETVTFDGSISKNGWNGSQENPITLYIWDFGDGNVTSGDYPTIVHSYAYVGIFKATLTISDSENMTSSCSQNILVMMPTSISISTSATSSLIGYTVNINGALSDAYGNAIGNEPVVLYYALPAVSGLFIITSTTTDNNGQYSAQWIPTATGAFSIVAEWTGNMTYSPASSNVTLNSIPAMNQYVFSVESNSTITGLAFNTTSQELSFTASGPSGTTGYAKVTIAKSLVSNITNIRVYLDNNQTDYSITSTDDSWLLTFNYTHSTHNVAVDLNVATVPEFPSFLILPLFFITTLLSALIYRKRRQRLVESQ